jgi:hypothetical protein
MVDIKKIRKLNIATHRDLGYFFSTLIIIYCLSGIALNHVDDWNPDFILKKKKLNIPQSYTKELINDKIILEFSKLVGEKKYKVYDFPTNDQVKIYFDNATLHVYLSKKEAVYEQVIKRPVFYQVNVLHRNSLKEWKWFSDIFALMLIIINITGLFILKGKHGITGRGKWLILAGTLPPVIALIIFTFK